MIEDLRFPDVEVHNSLERKLRQEPISKKVSPLRSARLGQAAPLLG